MCKKIDNKNKGHDFQISPRASEFKLWKELLRVVHVEGSRTEDKCSLK